MPVRVFALGDEPKDDLSLTTTAAERIEILIELSARMMELSTVPRQAYQRHEMPLRVFNRR